MGQLIINSLEYQKTNYFGGASRALPLNEHLNVFWWLFNWHLTVTFCRSNLISHQSFWLSTFVACCLAPYNVGNWHLMLQYPGSIVHRCCLSLKEMEGRLIISAPFSQRYWHTLSLEMKSQPLYLFVQVPKLRTVSENDGKQKQCKWFRCLPLGFNISLCNSESCPGFPTKSVLRTDIFISSSIEKVRI